MSPLERAAAYLLVGLVLSECSRRPAEVAAVAVERGMFGYAESERVAGRVEPGVVETRVTREGGCELVAHVGRCELTSVTVASDASGEREVVAVYRGLDDGTTQRFVRRFRVSYLARSEEEHIALVRERAVLGCRWQTVVRGACDAYPSEVDPPDAELIADASERSHRRHHHRHHDRVRSHHRIYHRHPQKRLR